MSWCLPVWKHSRPALQLLGFGAQRAQAARRIVGLDQWAAAGEWVWRRHRHLQPLHPGPSPISLHAFSSLMLMLDRVSSYSLLSLGPALFVSCISVVASGVNQGSAVVSTHAGDGVFLSMETRVVGGSYDGSRFLLRFLERSFAHGRPPVIIRLVPSGWDHDDDYWNHEELALGLALMVLVVDGGGESRCLPPTCTYLPCLA